MALCLLLQTYSVPRLEGYLEKTSLLRAAIPVASKVSKLGLLQLQQGAHCHVDADVCNLLRTHQSTQALHQALRQYFRVRN